MLCRIIGTCGYRRAGYEKADAKQYAELAENMKTAFHAEYFKPSTNVYATGSQ